MEFGIFTLNLEMHIFFLLRNERNPDVYGARMGQCVSLALADRCYEHTFHGPSGGLVERFLVGYHFYLALP